MFVAAGLGLRRMVLDDLLGALPVDQIKVQTESLDLGVFPKTELRGGEPAVLRATDLYNPLVSPWRDAGVFEACTGCWQNM